MHRLPEVRARKLGRKGVLCGIFIYLSLSVLGCNPSIRPDGHFEGILVQRKTTETEQQPVGIDIVLNKNNTGSIIALSRFHEPVFSVEIQSFSSNSVKLVIPGYYTSPIELVRNSGCYSSKPGTQGGWAVEFCYNAERFLLEINTEDHFSVFALSGDRFAPAVPPTLETPRSFLLSEAIQLALEKNFESRIQYEHLIQAKHAARAAFLSLLPSVGLSAILSLISPTVLGALGSIGNLAPFLLPTRWFQAKEASHAYHAEKLGRTLMQADLATEIEGLTYTLLRDQGLEAFYSKVVYQGDKIVEAIKVLEQSGGMPAGAVDPVQTSLYSAKMDLMALRAMVRQDLGAISQAMGFFSQTAVSNIVLDTESLPITEAKPLKPEEFREVVIARSFEIAQLDELIKVAEYQKQELYFSWLDPSAENSTDLGFGLREVIQIGKSRIQELKVRREQVQSAVLRRLGGTANEFNMSLNAYLIGEERRKLQDQRMERTLAQIYPGTPLSTNDIQSLLDDILSGGVRSEGILSGFRIARAKFDRLMLQGSYFQLQRRFTPAEKAQRSWLYRKRKLN